MGTILIYPRQGYKIVETFANSVCEHFIIPPNDFYILLYIFRDDLDNNCLGM